MSRNYPFAMPRAHLVRGMYLCQQGKQAAGMAALRLSRACAHKLNMPHAASLVRAAHKVNAHGRLAVVWC